jgi:hypothetical protein
VAIRVRLAWAPHQPAVAFHFVIQAATLTPVSTLHGPTCQKNMCIPFKLRTHLTRQASSTVITMAAASAFPLLLALLLLPAAAPARADSPSLPALPLWTSSRWVVGADGRRVKLACANWASHLEPAAAEGLARRGVGDIAARVVAMGFNCVRLTWPTYLATNATLASLPLRWSLERLGMLESVAGVRVNNPALLELPLIDVFRVRVLVDWITEISLVGLFVFLDLNHYQTLLM